MEVFVIYYNPDDYPGLYVVRRQIAGRAIVTPDSKPLGVSNSLAQARCSIPNGLIRFDRDPDDVPSIVEVWF